MTTILEKKLWESIKNIIQYQNNLLIRNISQDKNWNLDDLKKYIKNVEKKEKLIEVEKPKKKIKKIIKKSESPKVKITENESESSDSEGKIRIIKKKVIVKRKRKKLSTREINVGNTKLDKNEKLFQTIEYLNMEFLLNPENNYVYEKKSNTDEIVFVGIVEGQIINFDAESSDFDE